MEWYYAKHGKQEGPVDLATLQGKIQSGELAATDLIWKEGMPEWKAAGEVPEVAAVPQAAAPMVQAPHGQAPAQGVTPGPVPGMTPARSSSIGEVHIPNYLVASILVTVLCCWPLGIPAIVFAAKVDGLVARGEIAQAQHASDQAKLWCWISGGSGFAIIALYLVFVMVVAFSQ